jgi:hypothetical protein
MLAGLILTASSLVAAGGNRPMSPVGTWTVEYVDDVSPEGNTTIIQQYQFGGTLSSGAWGDNQTNVFGTWRRVGTDRFASTIWVMKPGADGYGKVIEEIWMIDKDTMEARIEGWWIVGPDPIDPPIPPIGPIYSGTQYYRRLKTESKQLP